MNRVLVEPADSSLAQKFLHDFNLEENGKKMVVRLKGEGKFRSAVFPEYAESGGKVLLEYLDAAGLARPALAWRWLQALRLPYLLFSLLPVILAGAIYFSRERSLPWDAAGLLVLSLAFVHASCNLWGEAEDHLRGVDAPEHTGGSGVIRKLWISARDLRLASAILFGCGALFGLGLLSLLPLRDLAADFFWLGLVGALGAASYSGWPFHYKYIGLGEPIVFFLSGPVVTMGATLIFFQNSGLFLFSAVVSLPLSFLAVMRLHMGNTQRIPFDSMAGVFTIARAWGFNRSKNVMVFLLYAPFFLVAAGALVNIAPSATFACLAALPHAFLLTKKLVNCKGPLDPVCQEVRGLLSQYHLIFGLTYCLAFLFF
jgi:1,4-dihydroxy-2-naphthoate octaprenyltransferase